MTIEELEVSGTISNLVKLLENVKEKYGDIEIFTTRNDECDCVEEQNVMFDVEKYDYRDEYYINFY